MQEQTNLIFSFICQKFVTKLTVIELDAKVRQVVVKEEVKLWQKLIIKKLKVWIAATVAATTAFVATP